MTPIPIIPFHHITNKRLQAPTAGYLGLVLNYPYYHNNNNNNNKKKM